MERDRFRSWGFMWFGGHTRQCVWAVPDSVLEGDRGVSGVNFGLLYAKNVLIPFNYFLARLSVLPGIEVCGVQGTR